LSPSKATNKHKIKMSEKKFPPLHVACSDDELRPELQHIVITGHLAVATNSVIVAALNMDEYINKDYIEILNGRHIHMDSWRTISKVPVEMLHFDEQGITFENEGTKIWISYGPEQTKLFNWTGIIPQEASHVQDPEALRVVRLSAQTLHNIM